MDGGTAITGSSKQKLKQSSFKNNAPDLSQKNQIYYAKSVEVTGHSIQTVVLNFAIITSVSTNMEGPKKNYRSFQKLMVSSQTGRCNVKRPPSFDPLPTVHLWSFWNVQFGK